MSAGIVLQQMVIIFLLIMTGYIAYKKGIVQDKAAKGISALVVNICNPALLVRSAFDHDASITYDKLFYAVLGGAILYAVLFLASWLLPKALKIEEKWRKHYSMMCLFGNTGFIGIPLVSAVFGEHAVIYVAVFNAYFNLIFYTYGIWLADGGKNSFSFKNFLNVGNLAIVLTIVIFAFQIQLPEVLTSTVNYMADTTTFLAMVVIGISLARTDLKSIFSGGKMYGFIALKFLLLPIAVSFLLRLVIKDEVVYGVTILMAAVPVGNLPLMRVEETGGDGTMLSKGIILSTVLSLVTIPVVTLFV